MDLCDGHMFHSVERFLKIELEDDSLLPVVLTLVYVLKTPR
jgi:hypothetical protein